MLVVVLFLVASVSSEVIEIPPRSVYNYTVSPVGKRRIFELHSVLYAVRLRSSDGLLEGRHLGLNLEPGYEGVLGLENRSKRPIRASAELRTVAPGYPVPGACSKRSRPSLNVSSDSAAVSVRFGEAGISSAGARIECGAELEYAVFTLYYRDGEDEKRLLALLNDPGKIRDEGLRVGKRFLSRKGPLPETRFAPYPGRVRVFAVLATKGNFTSAYVSSEIFRPAKRASVLSEGAALAFLLIGACLALFGHRFFKSSQFVLGLLTLTPIAYLALARFFDSRGTLWVPEISQYASGFGVLGSAFFLTVWLFSGLSVVPIVLSSVSSGMVISAVVCYFLYEWTLKRDSDYWYLFSGVVGVTAIFGSCLGKNAYVFSTSAVGVTLITLAVDFYLGGCLKYVFLIVVQRAYVEDFRTEFMAIPFEDKDVVLTCVWIFTCLGSIIFQHFRQRNSPSFPPHPFALWRSRREEAGRISENIINERSPLIMRFDRRSDLGAIDADGTAIVPAVAYFNSYGSAAPSEDSAFRRTSTDTREVPPSAPPPPYSSPPAVGLRLSSPPQTSTPRRVRPERRRVQKDIFKPPSPP